MAFAPIFQRPFSATFDRRAAVAAAPWWLAGGVAAANAVAVYKPIGSASLAASYDNIAAPGNGLADGTYDAASVIPPSFDAATGWTFVTADKQYLDTGVLLAGGYSSVVRFSDVSSGNTGDIIGHFNTNQRWMMRPTGVAWGYGNSALSAVVVAPSIASGVLALTAAAAYRDGTFDADLSAYAWTGTASYGLTIGARRRSDAGGTIDGWISAKIQAVAIYNTALTAPQVLAISTAMAAL